jgi:hypothetical protein
VKSSFVECGIDEPADDARDGLLVQKQKSFTAGHLWHHRPLVFYLRYAVHDGQA